MGFRHFFCKFRENVLHRVYVYNTQCCDIPNFDMLQKCFYGYFPFPRSNWKTLWQRIVYVDRRQKDETIWFRSFSLPFPLFKIFFYSLARSEPFYELSIFPVLWQFVTRVVCHYNPWCFFSSACYFFPMRYAATVFDTFWAPTEKFVVIPSVPYMLSN